MGNIRDVAGAVGTDPLCTSLFNKIPIFYPYTKTACDAIKFLQLPFAKNLKVALNIR